jgi:hypothetical protein
MLRFFVLYRFRAIIVAVWFSAILAATGWAAESSRFTDSLTAQQRTELGLNGLSSDNVAVINALVRQDESTVQLRNNNVRSTRFSQRRTEHERTIAGLDQLKPEQIAKLDELIGQRFAPAPSPLLESAMVPSALSVSSVENNSAPRRPEIHGSFSLTYGWGKGGSVMGGDATLMYEDPDHRYSVLFNYSQYRGKGFVPGLYPGDFYSPYSFRPLPDGSVIDR